MEFDTNVKQTLRCSLETSSDKNLDDFCKDLWPVVGKNAKNQADDGNGRIWVDYSTNMVTRYIIVDICDQTPEGQTPEGQSPVTHNYSIKIFSAKKPGYLADVIIAFLAIFTIWSISKILVPEPESIWVGALIASATIGGFISAVVTKNFGTAEAYKLESEIKKTLKIQ